MKSRRDGRVLCQLRTIWRQNLGWSVRAWATYSMVASDERVPGQPEARRVSRRTKAVRSRRLVGREREIAELAEIASVPLTTVAGPGGVGKTALALAVAAESSARFPDGVFVVWRASLRSAGLVAGEVAAQVGLQRSGGESNVDALTRWLADRDLLRVLDNCEHGLERSRALRGGRARNARTPLELLV